MWEAVYSIPIPDKQRNPGSFHPFQKVQLQIEKDGGRKSGIVWKVKILLREKGLPHLMVGEMAIMQGNVFAFFFFFLNNDHISQNVLREKSPFF